MDNPIVGGIVLLPIVFGLVEFVKKLKVEGNILTFISMGIGTLLGGLYQLVQLHPEYVPYFGVLVYGLGVGLAACGLYDFSKQFRPQSPPASALPLDLSTCNEASAKLKQIADMMAELGLTASAPPGGKS